MASGITTRSLAVGALRCLLLSSLLVSVAPMASSQAVNPGDYAITYGVNYSSADRKHTVFPGFIGPASFLYRPLCRFSVGIDDDTFVSNKTATARSSGTGDLGFEGHLALWNGTTQSVDEGHCGAETNSSLTLDYVVTVPVPGTLESTELVHQVKSTYNHPWDTGNFFVNAGLMSSGIPSGGTTQNGLVSANFLRYLNKTGTWAWEAESDLQSASKLAPSSAGLLVAIDATTKDQKWAFRLGTSVGLTPYAPKVSPFLQVSFNGTTRPKPAKKPKSVLKE